MDQVGGDAQGAGAAGRVRRGGAAGCRPPRARRQTSAVCTAAAYAGEPGIGRYDIDFCCSSTFCAARLIDSRIGVLPVAS